MRVFKKVPLLLISSLLLEVAYFLLRAAKMIILPMNLTERMPSRFHWPTREPMVISPITPLNLKT